MINRRRCRALRYKGHSIGQIAKRLKLSESTVHWHVCDIHLTRAQRWQLRLQKRLLMAQVNAKRRGISIRPQVFRTPDWSPALVHLVAHLNFDGRIDRYGCHYYNRSFSQVVHVKRLLQDLLGIQAKLKRRNNGIWTVRFYNVEVAAWLGQKERELLTVVSQQGGWQPQWLQALFDDEGHVHVAGHTRRVRASQDDPKVLQRAHEFLRTLGIQSRIDQAAQAVEITGRDNLTLFRDRINFSPHIYINPARKNGLVKQLVEKRTMLAFALDSYKLAL